VPVGGPDAVGAAVVIAVQSALPQSALPQSALPQSAPPSAEEAGAILKKFTQPPAAATFGSSETSRCRFAPPPVTFGGATGGASEAAATGPPLPPPPLPPRFQPITAFASMLTEAPSNSAACGEGEVRLPYKMAHVTHPELKATFHLPIIGVMKNRQGKMLTGPGVIAKGTVLEVNVSELRLTTPSGKVVWGKYAQVTNYPEDDGCVNAILLV
jgi:ribosomal protein S8E